MVHSVILLLQQKNVSVFSFLFCKDFRIFLRTKRTTQETSLAPSQHLWNVSSLSKNIWVPCTPYCVKSVPILGFSWSEYGKIRTRKNSVFGHFSCSASSNNTLTVGEYREGISNIFFARIAVKTSSPGKV